MNGSRAKAIRRRLGRVERFNTATHGVVWQLRDNQKRNDPTRKSSKLVRRPFLYEHAVMQGLVRERKVKEIVHEGAMTREVERTVWVPIPANAGPMRRIYQKEKRNDT